MERNVKHLQRLPVHIEVASLNEGNKSKGTYAEARAVDVFQAALDAIIVFNHEGKIVDANPAFCSIINQERDRIIGRTLHDFVPYEKHYKLKRQQELLEQTGKARGVIPVLTSDGVVYFEAVTSQRPDSLLCISIMRDITIRNRNRMERELLEGEKKFRRIFEGSMDGLILWNDDFKIVDINCAAEKMFGLSKEKLKGRIVFEFFSEYEEQKRTIIDHIDQVIEFGNDAGSLIMETDGQTRYYDFSSKRDIVEGLNFTVIKDVSDNVKMQSQLRKSDRLNVIGELAAGIAHEIRNPMTSLKGFIQLLENSIKAEHELYYQVITSELARIDSIINEFLILAKPQAIRFLEMDVNQILRETVDLLNAQAALCNVQFLIQYDKAIPPFYCEPNQLKKVFINIIKNAIEVMRDGGKVTITTKQINEEYLTISISDEGPGIPKEQIKKLGEPFYTTKEGGTGLGLMVSFQIIEEHKGSIQIVSEVGKGSTFHITLPLLSKK